MPFEELKARARTPWCGRGRPRAHRRGHQRDPPGAGRVLGMRFEPGSRVVARWSRWRGLAAGSPRRCPITAESRS